MAKKYTAKVMSKTIDFGRMPLNLPLDEGKEVMDPKSIPILEELYMNEKYHNFELLIIDLDRVLSLDRLDVSSAKL